MPNRKEDGDGFVVESTTAPQEGLRQFLGVEEESPPEFAEPVQEAAPVEETPSEAVSSEETEQETAGDESGATEELEEQEEEKPKARKSRASRRIDRLTREKYETQRRLDEAERRLAAMPLPEQPQPTEPPTLKAKPEVDEFETYEQYVEELTDWKVAQVIAGERQAYAQDQAQRARQEYAQVWNTKLEAAREIHEDFEEVVNNPDIPVSPAMGEAIIDSGIGAEILYWLGKNPEASRELAVLPPLAAAREIGKLEWHLAPLPESSGKETPLAPSPTPKVSSAPAPISPVGGNTDRTNIPLDQMGMDQFTRERERQIAARGS